ncbi:putative VapC ribonuclease Y4jK (fragment) [Agrobacterium deltaense RV3]
MIVVDTNAISELWKVESDSSVLTWIDSQMVETLYLSTITIAELRFGLTTMPEGKRRTIYQDRLEREVLPVFTGRILSFDLDASQAYA